MKFQHPVTLANSSIFRDNENETNGFGEYYDRLGLYHLGQDYFVNAGTDVAPITNGQTVEIGYNESFGKYVVLKHDLENQKNIFSLYAHLSDISDHIDPNGIVETAYQNENNVQHEIENVKLSVDGGVKTDIVGRSGDTGDLEGPHLHLEIAEENRFNNNVSPDENPSGPYAAGYDTKNSPAFDGKEGVSPDGDEVLSPGRGVYDPRSFINTQTENEAPERGSDTVFIQTDNGKLFKHDPSNNNVSEVGTSGRTLTDIAETSDGTLYGVTFNSLYRVGKEDASLEFIKNIPAGTNALASIENSETLLAATTGGEMYKINLSDNSTSSFATLPKGSSGDIAVLGSRIFVTVRERFDILSNDDLLEIDGEGNVIKKISLAEGNVYGLIPTRDGNLKGYAGQSTFNIDPDAGIIKNAEQLDLPGFLTDINGAAVALDEGGPNKAASVFRFYNEQAGGHFFTRSENERDAVMEMDEFRFEGVGFHAFEEARPGTEEIYRFFNTEAGGHFFTRSEGERDAVMEMDEFRFEGVGFHALPTSNVSDDFFA